MVWTSRMQTFEDEMLADNENFYGLARINRELIGKAEAPDSVHSALGWEDMLLPEIERQQKPGSEVVFRADAAFAKPEITEALEERGVEYAIRILSNDSLDYDMTELPTRSVRGPSYKPVVRRAMSSLHD